MASKAILCFALLVVGVLSHECLLTCSGEQVCSKDTGVCLGPYAQDAKWQIWVSVSNEIEPNFDKGLSDLINVANGGPDDRWLHLHRRGFSPRGYPVGNSTLSVKIRNGGTKLEPSASGIKIRYTIANVPITDWLEPPFVYELNIENNPSFDTKVPQDGIFHLSCEVLGVSATKADFVPVPIHAHIKRPGFPTATVTPVGLYEGNEPDTENPRSIFNPDPLYIDVNSRKWIGYPMSSDLQPWSGLPHQSQLYVEQMAAVTPLFQPLQMWWADPAHNDLPFVRGFPPKHDEMHNGLRLYHRHERFPTKDGPRGVGWMSSYVTGQFDSAGRFVFAETSGRIGYLYPDGEIFTIAGWVTDPNKDPVWYKKTLDVVRKNQILRGKWTSGGKEFKTPLDVTPDPKNDRILYVAAFEDHCIWKVEIKDIFTRDVVVSVFAGDVAQTPGAIDGKGTDARFNGPTSLVFDPVRDCIYVADQNNGRVRKITREGEVTTLFGGNNVKNPYHWEFPSAPQSVIDNCGRTQWSRQTCARINAKVEGENPDIFLPHTIRVDSTGRIIILDLGFGTIRRIDPQTKVADIRGRVNSKLSDWTRGWAWMDVDRTGNSGAKDGIVWCKFVGEVFGASHGANVGDPGCTEMYKDVTCSDRCYQNDNKDHTCPYPKTSNMFSEPYGYIPPDNSDKKSYLLFNIDWTIQPNSGPLRKHDPPHYPWLVAFHPKGAIYVAGSGQHGIRRIRKMKDTDTYPEFTATSWDYLYYFWNGRAMFEAGTPKAIYGRGAFNPSFGPVSVYNWDGHNILGINDTWGMAHFTDEQLLDSFRIPNLIRNDAESKGMVIKYLRAATGTTKNDVPNTEVYIPGRIPPMEGESTQPPPPSPVDCEWDAWVDGECTGDCDNGQMIRTRSIKIYKDHGGKECEGLAEETVPCTYECQPIDCEWDAWVDGECTGDCDNGQMIRTRSIKIYKDHGGNECEGLAEETVPCTYECQSVDCVWGPWVDGECIGDCNNGQMTRKRSIQTYLEHGGQPCEGTTEEIVPCTYECPVFETTEVEFILPKSLARQDLYDQLFEVIASSENLNIESQTETDLGNEKTKIVGNFKPKTVNAIANQGETFNSTNDTGMNASYINLVGGIVVGLLLGLVVLTLFFYLKHKKQKQQEML